MNTLQLSIYDPYEDSWTAIQWPHGAIPREGDEFVWKERQLIIESVVWEYKVVGIINSILVTLFLQKLEGD